MGPGLVWHVLGTPFHEVPPSGWGINLVRECGCSGAGTGPMLLWVCWGHSGLYETLAKIQGSASPSLELPGPRGAGRVLGDSWRRWQLVGVPLCLGGQQVQGILQQQV